QTYASELGADPTFASIFVSILEAGNGISRIIFGWCGDRWIGRINVLFLTTFLSGIFTSVIWQNAISIHVFMLYCVLFGLTGGVFSGFQPVISAEIVGMDRIQEGVGVSYFLSLFGILTGTPIMGSLHLHYGWMAAIQFTGAMTIASALALLGTRFLFNKRLLAKV
ncbi:MFS general substrate transporter, partial [Lichtheimia hyalospora FSU 10163]